MPDNDRYIEPLTAREQEILALLAEGCSTNDIVAGLFISKATARNHIQAILEKLGAHSRLEAVAIARRRVDDPGGRLIRLGSKGGMALTVRQKEAVRAALLPPEVTIVEQRGPPAMEHITVTMSQGQHGPR